MATTAWPVPDVYTPAEARAAKFLPGHMPGETAIVKAWLDQNAGRYDAFAFNVRVGQGVDPVGQVSESAARFVKATTQKRIDILAFVAGQVELYEVKIQANLGALGQMLGYVHLWQIDHPDWTVRHFGVLAKYISPDTATVFDKHGLTYYLLSDVELPPLVPRSP